MNVELARAALAAAKAHPDNFDMGSWWSSGEVRKDAPDTAPPCGTTACYAGFVFLLVAPVGASIRAGWVYLPGNDHWGPHVEDYAIKALDITRSQAGSLFYLHDIEEVERAIEYLADNPDATGEALDRAARPEREYA